MKCVVVCCSACCGVCCMQSSHCCPTLPLVSVSSQVKRYGHVQCVLQRVAGLCSVFCMQYCQ